MTGNRSNPAGDDTPHLLRLVNGRRLAFAEYGDPDGYPVIYCHGFPSSRREALLLHEQARTRGARIISPDRPGYGDSDVQEGRTLVDWPLDVSALADHLGLERFALLGISGGAPFALACAERIPERLTASALVCPLGPIFREDILMQMNWAPRINLALAQRAPRLSEWLFGRITTGFLAHLPETVDHLRSISAPESDRKVLEDPATRSILNRTIQDAMRDGALGARQDLMLYTSPWGIEFTAIRTHVQIWHGEADGTVPPAHSRWYATHLPNTDLICVPNEGHFSLPLRFSREILKQVLARPQPAI